MTHICVGKLTVIGSDNGLSSEWRQAYIWTNAGILLIGTLGTNFSEILIKILTYSFKKMRLKVSSGKWRPFCLGLHELKQDCLNSSVLAMGLPQCSAWPSIYTLDVRYYDYKWNHRCTVGLFQYQDRISKYRDLCYKDAIAVKPSYLYHENFYAGKAYFDIEITPCDSGETILSKWWGFLNLKDTSLYWNSHSLVNIQHRKDRT